MGRSEMANKDIIVIGSSLGGIEALKNLVRDLPRDLSASLFVVQHTSPHYPSYLPEILVKFGPLPVAHAQDKEPFKPAHIYVAPPDHHLLVEKDFMRVTRGPRENRFRPSVDALFRSAAYTYGPRVVGVVLTGLLDDGTAGLWAVKDRGGTAVVQDPLEAYAGSMPGSAMNHVEVDYCLPLSAIPPLLTKLARTRAAEESEHPVSKRMKIEFEIAKEEAAIDKGIQDLFEPSNYTCPDCQGVLLQMREGNHLRFRCHTGHAYSAESLLAQTSETIEDTLWSAIRALEERILLLRQLAEHHRSHRQQQESGRLTEQALALELKAHQIRRVVMNDAGLQINAAGVDERS
jgi:two-component system chemotaxis response regulator CheB